MICCQFVFEPGEYDDEFHSLDAKIEIFAQALPGYVSVHRWQSADGRFKNSNYFFKDQASVKELARYPEHLTAKKEYSRWYKGYQILITEVLHSYGDGNIQYP